MKKLKYCGPDDHVVLFLESGSAKFKLNQVKEVSELFAQECILVKNHKFELIEEAVKAEAKVLPARARNRQMAKAEVKDGSEL